MFYNFITKCSEFFVEKIREAYAKASHIFSTKILGNFRYFNVRNFNETLTNDVVTFEQPGPVVYHGRDKRLELHSGHAH